MREAGKFLGFGRKVLKTKPLERKKRKDALSESTKITVRKFWKSESVARILPLKKRVKKGQPPYLLECSYSEAYKRFRLANPEVKIGYCRFISLKPKNVMLMRAAERIVCCCIRCENVKLKLEAMNKIAQIEKMKNLNIEELVAMTVCPVESDGKHPAKTCLDRKCGKCGVDAIERHFEHLTEDHGDTIIQFDEWKVVNQEVQTIKGGAERKVVRKLKRITSNATQKEVLHLLMADMKQYPNHKFRATWQKSQFDAIKNSMPPHSAVVVLDFAMNYTCYMQDEVQSYHWAPPQVTIHPCYCYINDSDKTCAPTHHEALNIISSDLKHDAAAVAKFTKICADHLQKTYSIEKMIQFSDCAASQYRCSTSFADLSFGHKDLGIHVERHYFESSHGKSPSDGQTKREASIAVTRRQAKIRSAEELYEFCLQKLSTVGESVFPSHEQIYEDAQRRFFFVNSKKIERERHDRLVKQVTGTMAVHAVKATGKAYEILTRELSCFCQHCIQNDGDCINKDFVGEWSPIHLRVKSAKTQAKPQSDSSMENTTQGEKDTQATGTSTSDLALNGWIAVIYDNEWWPGVVEEIDTEGEQVVYCTKFMKPCNINRFVWPQKQETDRLLREEILTILQEPPTPISRRHYHFDEKTFSEVQDIFISVIQG